jgi:hypothetical protein
MTEPEERSPAGQAQRRPSARRQFPRVRASAAIAIAALIGFGVWLAVRGSGSSSSTAPTTLTTPRVGAVAISQSGLQTLSSASGQPIFWAGPKSGYTYELTKTSDGRVYVRYLPSGVALGSDTPYLTIGTYPVANAYSVTKALAAKSGTAAVHVGNGGIAFYSKSAPTSVYLAYPGVDYQVETYSPSAAEARQLVASGQVAPAIGSVTGSAAARAASPADLKQLATALQHPIYWVGSRAGTTYELKKTSNGNVYVRYLPQGVQVGVDKPYLTIGTYPVQNALAVTQAQSTKADAVRIPIGGGAVAFYNKTHNTSVYLAFPGSDVQVEVYDPTSGTAVHLVSSRRVAPVG